VERFENGSDMSVFRSLNNSTSKRVLNLLEPVKLTVWKVMIEGVTVVKFRVNYGGGICAGCFEVKVLTVTATFTDVIVAKLRKCSLLLLVCVSLTKLVSHKTASSSAECSRDKPPFSFVRGQDSTM